MSESAQYIQIREGFEKCCTLNDEGALLVSDYLRENVARDNVRGSHTKKINYLEIAKKYGLR